MGLGGCHPGHGLPPCPLPRAVSGSQEWQCILALGIGPVGTHGSEQVAGGGDLDSQ